MSLSSDFQKLDVQGIITLYELDATNVGAGVMRFHGHANDYLQDIIWQGETYNPIPIKSDGLEVRGDGRASTPTLSLANKLNGMQGAISALCLRFDDFAGAKLTVYTTLARHLDAANFTDGNPQASDEHKKQVWYIEQKTSENASVVSFELSNPVDFEGVKIPCREITSYCHWCVRGRYRGEECGYTGAAMFKKDGTPTDNPALDECGGTLHDCQLRFGENEPLSHGGFPSSRMV